MRDLVSNLPSGQQRPAKNLEEDTVVAILNTIHEIVTDSSENARSLIQAQAVEKLVAINRTRSDPPERRTPPGGRRWYGFRSLDFSSKLSHFSTSYVCFSSFPSSRSDKLHISTFMKCVYAPETESNNHTMTLNAFQAVISSIRLPRRRFFGVSNDSRLGFNKAELSLF